MGKASALFLRTMRLFEMLELKGDAVGDLTVFANAVDLPGKLERHISSELSDKEIAEYLDGFVNPHGNMSRHGGERVNAHLDRYAEQKKQTEKENVFPNGTNAGVRARFQILMKADLGRFSDDLS